MVRDLNFPIEIIGAPTVREADGLACSSRNQYLNTTERRQAPVLRAALLQAQRLAAQGERAAPTILDAARKAIATAPLARIDYFELVSPDTLQPIDLVQPNSLVASVVGSQTRTDVGGAAILPNNRSMHCFAGFAVPHDSGFTLVGNPNCRHVTCS